MSLEKDVTELQESFRKINEVANVMPEDWLWAKFIEYDHDKFWPVFEHYASGNFNEVADYSYKYLGQAISSGIEFIKNKRNFLQNLKQKFGVS